MSGETTLSINTFNLMGKGVEAVDLGDGKIIIKDHLTDFDIEALEAANESGEGANLLEKMGTHVLPNGRTAMQVYGRNIRTGDGYKADVYSTYAAQAPNSELARLVADSDVND